MKRHFRLLWSAILIGIGLQGGHMVASGSTIVTAFAVRPNKAFYRPHEAVTFIISGAQGNHLYAEISHLTETVATLEAPINANGQAQLIWTPPAITSRGYGVQVYITNADGVTIAHTATAFDVLDHWIQAPRYGFLSTFQPGRKNATETMELLTQYHVNGLQFYDWQYRHAQLVPPTEVFQDVLGRTQSYTVIKDLIEAAHAKNIAAMPYTAIYGAAYDFYEQHPDWALFQIPHKPYLFGDHFLVIMDPSPDSPWTAHLMTEFKDVLQRTTFDGIHIDQYGAPKVGLNAQGQHVDLAKAFPAFIDKSAEVVQQLRGEDGVVIFNAVGNWPVDTVAPAKEDAVYIEVWPPYVDFWDLHRIVRNAEKQGGGKPVIIAAYIHPNKPYNWRLADAIIMASGAYHLELGEPNAMLADPYFPKFGLLDANGKDVLRRYYDFQVTYEERLALDTVMAPPDRAKDLTMSGVNTGVALFARDRVAVIVRQGANFETFSLVNFLGLAHSRWEETLSAGPTPLENRSVQLKVTRPVKRLWWASPDGDRMIAQPIEFTTEGSTLTFNLPSLLYWDMIVVEYAS